MPAINVQPDIFYLLGRRKEAGLNLPDFKPGEDFARKLDGQDALAHFRQEFYINDPDLIYLDGNSLGRLPKATRERICSIVEAEWGNDLIRGWNANWYQAPARVGEKIARLVGAAPRQVIVSDSTSVNLFKLACAALELRPDRACIVSDMLNFPSDIYILQGIVSLLGNQHNLRLVPSPDGISIDLEDIGRVVNQDTALLTVSQVVFKSGFLYNVAELTQMAHQAGALVLLDLSHSVGAVPIELDEWGVDLAIGCTYKYLNGGPGAPAFLYVNHALQQVAFSPIWGWFGQQAPFAFDLDYSPAEGVRRFLVSSPPILSLLAMEAGLDLQIEAGIGRIRQKSIALTSYLIYLFDRVLAPLGFTLGSPRDPSRRGSHISIRHPEGYRINRALIEEMHVLPDFREPDNIRLGLAPLYTTFWEVWAGVERIRRVVVEGNYLRYSTQRQAVT